MNIYGNYCGPSHKWAMKRNHKTLTVAIIRLITLLIFLQKLKQLSHIGGHILVDESNWGKAAFHSSNSRSLMLGWVFHTQNGIFKLYNVLCFIWHQWFFAVKNSRQLALSRLCDDTNFYVDHICMWPFKLKIGTPCFCSIFISRIHTFRSLLCFVASPSYCEAIILNGLRF